MEPPHDTVPRRATPADAGTVAHLLDAFNREFDTVTPGVAVLTARLEQLLVDPQVVVLLVGRPADGLLVLTLRPNVWHDGPVALVDELYVAPESRGRGLGTSLLAAAEAVTRTARAALVEVTVDGEDVDARRFYERHGYANSAPGEDDPLLYYYREL